MLVTAGASLADLGGHWCQLGTEGSLIVMDPVANPYRSGAGRRPPLLAGRKPVLDAFTVVRRKADEYGEGERGWIRNGLRSVGKTVLLNEMLSQVSSQGWIAAKVEATTATPCPSL